MNRVVALVVMLAAVCCCAQAEDAQQPLPRYTVRKITGIPFSEVIPKAINGKGDVLIWIAIPRIQRSYLWSNGKVTEIGNLGGKRLDSEFKDGEFAIPGTIGYGLNDRGQVVGSSQAADGHDHAFLWERGKMRDLGTLGGKASKAYDINNHGQVVGELETSAGERHAFIWDQKNGMRDLGIPGKISAARKINEKGQVLGGYTEWAAFVWDKGKISYPDANPVKDFGTFQGSNINDRGDIVGSVGQGKIEDGESRVLVYSQGKFIAVETSAKSSNAFGLTSDGLVVGNAFDAPTGQHAFVWRDGKFALLNDLLKAKGWDVYFTEAASDQGQIAAVGGHGRDKNGRLTGYPLLLTPVTTAGSK